MTLQNVVATVNLGVPIDLESLSQKYRIAEYNPRRFQAVIMRIREPRTTALIFRTGKMIVTGAKSIVDSEIASKKYTAIVQKAGFAARYESYTIQNMTGCFDSGFPISLEGLLYADTKFCTYEPELFPGLVYRMPSPKVCFLVFVSGKVVITGAKSKENLENAMANLYPRLLEFRKRTAVTR